VIWSIPLTVSSNTRPVNNDQYNRKFEYETGAEHELIRDGEWIHSHRGGWASRLCRHPYWSSNQITRRPRSAGRSCPRSTRFVADFYRAHHL